MSCEDLLAVFSCDEFIALQCPPWEASPVNTTMRDYSHVRPRRRPVRLQAGAKRKVEDGDGMGSTSRADRERFGHHPSKRSRSTSTSSIIDLTIDTEEANGKGKKRSDALAYKWEWDEVSKVEQCFLD